jgi:hypothetical protein
MQGLNASADIKSNGWPLRARFGGVFDLRAEDEAQAKKPGGPLVDMLAASEIRTDRRLPNARKMHKLVVELSGIGDFGCRTVRVKKSCRAATGKRFWHCSAKRRPRQLAFQGQSASAF